MGKNGKNECEKNWKEWMGRTWALIGYRNCKKTQESFGFTEHLRCLSWESGFVRLCLLPRVLRLQQVNTAIESHSKLWPVRRLFTYLSHSPACKVFLEKDSFGEVISIFLVLYSTWYAVDTLYSFLSWTWNNNWSLGKENVINK